MSTVGGRDGGRKGGGRNGKDVFMGKTLHLFFELKKKKITAAERIKLGKKLLTLSGFKVAPLTSNY